MTLTLACGFCMVCSSYTWHACMFKHSQREAQKGLRSIPRGASYANPRVIRFPRNVRMLVWSSVVRRDWLPCKTYGGRNEVFVKLTAIQRSLPVFCNGHILFRDGGVHGSRCSRGTRQVLLQVVTQRRKRRRERKNW